MSDTNLTEFFKRSGLAPTTPYEIIAFFESQSKPGVDYSVVRYTGGKLACNCPGFFHRKYCWHLREARKKR